MAEKLTSDKALERMQRYHDTREEHHNVLSPTYPKQIAQVKRILNAWHANGTLRTIKKSKSGELLKSEYKSSRQ